MKKLLFTSLLSLALLFPASIGATANMSTPKTELSVQNQKQKKKGKQSKRNKKNNAKGSKHYSQNKGCTYNGHQLYVGKRGGCYYYAGNSKEYVDRSYCSGCN
ncbi:hypothetical protein [uncultured Chryseobacterium sp.]|jgi:hypothetical protein|uniref:hypothetical protein n=1 Tax=uncultured Chryseobacterium sp. TaxID=259322 RepID=UPI002617C06C|nr:hypothetical protein [uncultured Chryseobacterium sp.]